MNSPSKSTDASPRILEAQAAMERSVCSFGRDDANHQRVQWTELKTTMFDFVARQEEVHAGFREFVASGKQAFVLVGDPTDDIADTEEMAHDTCQALFMHVFVSSMRLRKEREVRYAGNEDMYWRTAYEKADDAKRRGLIIQPHDGVTGYSVNAVGPFYANNPDHHRAAPHTALVLTKMNDIERIAASNEGMKRILTIRREIVKRFGGVSNGNELFVSETPDPVAVMTLDEFDRMNADLYRKIGYFPS